MSKTRRRFPQAAGQWDRRAAGSCEWKGAPFRDAYLSEGTDSTVDLVLGNHHRDGEVVHLDAAPLRPVSGAAAVHAADGGALNCSGEMGNSASPFTTRSKGLHLACSRGPGQGHGHCEQCTRTAANVCLRTPNPVASARHKAAQECLRTWSPGKGVESRILRATSSSDRPLMLATTCRPRQRPASRSRSPCHTDACNALAPL